MIFNTLAEQVVARVAFIVAEEAGIAESRWQRMRLA
jgi:hypothetical protein